MVSVGFRSGAMDQVMRRIANRYEDEVTDQISRIISILEPTLVAALSVVDGVIFISVMLPLMGVMSSIG
jgi:type IV pilus assembly protein PilC